MILCFSDIKGVKITVEKNNLNLPHVIATYNAFNGTLSGIFSIRTGKLIKGNLPAEKVEQIESYIVLNEQTLMKYWEKVNK